MQSLISAAIVCVFVLAQLAHAANRPLGFLVAPHVLVANQQGFWAGLKLWHCPSRYDLTQNSKATHFCTVIWGELPNQVKISDNKLTLSAQYLPEGTFKLTGTIDRFSVSDPTKPVEEEHFGQTIQSIPLNPMVTLSGLPLNPTQENTLWLESNPKAPFHCIFYEGIPVQTSPDRIDQHKLYCRVSWLNIPPGFKQKRAANPAVLEGNLESPDSVDPEDHTFRYQLSIEIPYSKTINLPVDSIDASKDVLNTPTVTWTDHLEKGRGYYITSTRHPSVPLAIQASNQYMQPLKLSLIDLDAGNRVVKTWSFPDAFTHHALNLSAAELKPGQLRHFDVQLAYRGKATVAPASHSITTLVMPDPKARLHLSSIVGHPATLNIAGTLPEAPTKNGGLWRVYLAPLSESLLSNTKPTEVHNCIKHRHAGYLVIAAHRQFQLPIPLNDLTFGRYAVVADLISEAPSGLTCFATYLSNPIAVNVLASHVPAHTVLTQPLPVGGWSVTVASARLAKRFNDEPWNYGAEKGTAKQTEEPIAIPFVQHLNAPGTFQYWIAGSSASSLPRLKVLVYAKPNYQLVAPPSMAPNAAGVAQATLQGKQVNPTKHSLTWNIDGRQAGSLSAQPLSFNTLGAHAVTLTIANPQLPDIAPLADTHIRKTIHVTLQDTSAEPAGL